MKTLVIGLGNPILTDDGVGIHTARLVQTALPIDMDVDVIEVSVGGLALMEAMVGYDRVILVDALWTQAEAVGQVIVFDAGDQPETLNTRSSHDVDLSTALRLGRKLGASLPSNDHIQIVAITANNVLNFGECPTPPVQNAMPEARDSVLKLLDRIYDTN
jgi:hydrogenase maturation protease